MDLINCPYCNLHAHTKYRYTEIVLCGYCKIPIARNKKNTLQIKPAAKPEEFKFDLIDKSFVYNNHHYKITGYIRYFYNEGYLYQWAAYNHNTYVWLCESLGNWFIVSPEKEFENINVSKLSVNTVFSYKGDQYTVDELSLFYNYYMEGELPDFFYTQTKGKSIECSSKNKIIQFNVLENNQIEMYTGQHVNFKDLNINLR
jgi:hypothetical protein